MVYKESIRSILNTAIEILEEDSFPFQYDKQLTVLDLVLSKLTNSHRDIASEDPNIQDAFKSIIDEVEKYKSTQHISLFFTHSPELQHLSYDEKVKLIIDESIKYFTEKQQEIASKHQEIQQLLSLSPNAQNEQIKQRSKELVDEADIRRKLSNQHQYSLKNEDIEKLVAAEIERLAKKEQAKYQTAVEIYLKPAQADEIAARYKDREEKAFQEEIKRSKKAMLQPKANQNSVDVPNFVQAKLLTMDQAHNFSHESQTIYSAYFGSNPEQIRRYFRAIKDFYSCDEERGIKEISEMPDAKIGGFLTDKAISLFANKIISPADAAKCPLFDHPTISHGAIDALSEIKSVCVAQKVFQEIKIINIQLEEEPNREDSVNQNIASIKAQAATLANEYISRSELLIEAIKAKDSNRFTHLITSGALINYIDSENKSILEHSFEADFAEGVQAIINSPDFNVNMVDANGDTLLINAMSKNKTEVVKAILKHPKINVNARDARGITTLAWAIFYIPKEILIAILKHPNIDVNAYITHYTTLSYAVMSIEDWYAENLVDIKEYKPIYDDIIAEVIKHPKFNLESKINGKSVALWLMFNGKQDVLKELQAKGRKISLTWLDRYNLHIFLPLYNPLKKAYNFVAKQPIYIKPLLLLVLPSLNAVGLAASFGVEFASSWFLDEVLLSIIELAAVFTLSFVLAILKTNRLDITTAMFALEYAVYAQFVADTVGMVGSYIPAIKSLLFYLQANLALAEVTAVALTMPPEVFQKIIEGARACGNAVQYVAQYTAQKVVDGAKYCGNIMKSAAVQMVDSVKACGNAIYSAVDYSKSCVVSSLKNIKDFLFVRPSIVSHANVEASQQKNNQQAPTLREIPSAGAARTYDRTLFADSMIRNQPVRPIASQIPSAGAATHGIPSRAVSRVTEACNTR